MTRFYCPGCWEDFAEDLDPCPHCGLNIQSFLDSLDRVEKLVVALEHREPSTRLRAAWLLGEAGGSRAVEALVLLATRTKDIYLKVTAIRALGKSGDVAAKPFLEGLAEHPSPWVRQEATEALGRLAAETGVAKEPGARGSSR
jgi:HEAT repeat protein